MKLSFWNEIMSIYFQMQNEKDLTSCSITHHLGTKEHL